MYAPLAAAIIVPYRTRWCYMVRQAHHKSL